MSLFKWTIVGLLAFAAITNLADTRKHGFPRSPHNATHSAMAAVLDVLMIVWALTVLP